VTSLVAFVRLGRPLFLGGGFILFAIGAAVAAATGHALDWHRYALGQLCVTAFQLMTHYANDYFDLEADRANATPTAWSGGSRVLPDGELSPRVALVAALVLAGLGCVAAIVLGHALGTLAVIAVLAWSYSAPPLRLCARGLGELTTAIVVTVLVPLVGFELQAPDFRGAALLGLSVVPLALLQFAMLVAIEFPDAAGDAATGKRTLVVQLGARAASLLYVGAVVAAYAWPVAALAFGLPVRTAVLMLVPAPIAAWRIARMLSGDHADPAAYETLTFWAVALLVATSGCVLASWLMNSSTLASS
jgi:1,4-dihydroxy-2-naphthoate polyprenyltransferase